MDQKFSPASLVPPKTQHHRRPWGGGGSPAHCRWGHGCSTAQALTPNPVKGPGNAIVLTGSDPQRPPGGVRTRPLGEAAEGHGVALAPPADPPTRPRTGDEGRAPWPSPKPRPVPDP